MGPRTKHGHLAIHSNFKICAFRRKQHPNFSEIVPQKQRRMFEHGRIF